MTTQMQEAPAIVIPDRYLIPLAGTAAVVGGAAMAIDPITGGLCALAPILLVALIRSSIARVSWFIGGGLLVFQATDSVGGPKVAYLTGVILSAVVSTIRVARSDAAWLEPFRPLLHWTSFLVVAIGVSGVVAHWNSPAEEWFRDAAPYILLAVAPPVALDAAHDIREERLHILIAVLGIVTAAGFAADWLNRRGASSLPFGRLILATGAIGLLALCLALGKIAAKEHTVRWTLVAVVVPVIALTTGTRSVLVQAVSILGAVGTRGRYRMSAGKAIVLGFAAVLAVTLLTPRLAGIVGDDAFYRQRMDMAVTTFQERGAGDGSFEARSQSYATAWQTWRDHRWWGVGPGTIGTMDTPVITLAKFGIVGTAVILLFLGSLVLACRRAGRQYGWAPAHTAVRCYALVFVAALPLGSRIEDKGFAMAVLLALCAVGVNARLQATTEDVATDVAVHAPDRAAPIRRR